jgi:S1-C subfamily serine protease
MKLRYLLLFAASALLITPIPTISAPVQIAYESQIAKGSVRTTGESVYQMANPAVVMVFAGREIGSGSIVSPDGLVITNHHVARGSSSGQVFVRTDQGQRYPGRVVATDRRYDLALIQLDTVDRLPTVRLASGAGIQPGEPVFAIGSPYGRQGVMTTGTFRSARSNGDLQSRVVLRPGNSGGPLLNAEGEMVGVNKAILEAANGNNTGISIATSSQLAKQFIESYRPGSTLAVAPPSYLNINPTLVQRSPRYNSPLATPATPSVRRQGEIVIVTEPYSSSPNPGIPNPGSFNRGIPNQFDLNPSSPHQVVPTNARLGVVVDMRTLVVQQVQMGSAAANGGIRVGDRLLGVNGQRLDDFDDLLSFMQQSPSIAQFTINRDGRAETLPIRF